jgi:hypothetical protein
VPRSLPLAACVRAVAAAVSIGLALASCSALGPGGSPSGGPGSSAPPTATSSPPPTAEPSPTVRPDEIEHATAATNVILRFAQSGGFVAPGFLVTQGPEFSLYGDGTVIFRDPIATAPPPTGNVHPQPPYQIARLNEEQIQSLLQFAIRPGSLGIAKAQYHLPVADAPDSIFTIAANGTTKTVSVNGLGIGESQPGPDSTVLAALATLRDRLLGLGSEIGGEQVWSPSRYRGILSEDAFNPPVAWPWPAIQPSDFVQRKGPNDPIFPIRTMTPDEAAALGIAHIEGGVQGIALRGPDGKTYSFSLRPIWPDETY